MSAPDDDPMHAQLARLCDVVDRLVRVVVRVDERRRVETTGLPSRRCDHCAIVTVEFRCPACSEGTYPL